MRCTICVLIISFYFIQFQSCYTVLQHTDSKTTAAEIESNKSIVEGIVSYHGTANTRETHYQPGFILIQTHWIVNPPPYDAVIYLIGSIDSSYLYKSVRIEGTYAIPRRRPESPYTAPDYTSELFFDIIKLQILK